MVSYAGEIIFIIICFGLLTTFAKLLRRGKRAIVWKSLRILSLSHLQCPFVILSTLDVEIV